PTGLPVGLKWPNDVILRGKKAGGLLIEAGLSGETLDYAVIGIGLNLNLDVSQIPEIAATATSISTELGEPVSRLKLLGGLLELLEEEYTRLESGASPHQRWAERLTRVGEHVEVETPWGRESGRMEGADTDGALILRRDDGTRARITVGDVS
ncbi:MAG: biotin--[acetyl-CoA-carboxylase] ligase, partial [Anaerolineae bacterium]|nr:biotin--[acetyl-CoA-carboxylase] ligase [Anaerolineae bacterium]